MFDKTSRTHHLKLTIPQVYSIWFVLCEIPTLRILRAHWKSSNSTSPNHVTGNFCCQNEYGNNIVSFCFFIFLSLPSVMKIIIIKFSFNNFRPTRDDVYKCFMNILSRICSALKDSMDKPVQYVLFKYVFRTVMFARAADSAPVGNNAKAVATFRRAQNRNPGFVFG